jgi:PAS domain S-box-containing protein
MAGTESRLRVRSDHGPAPDAEVKASTVRDPASCERVLAALRRQSEILNLITGGFDTRQTLMRLAELCERSFNGAICAVQVVDPDRTIIAETIAPRLAPGLIHALADERLSHEVSPGARAIVRRGAVIVPDIGEDESPEFRQLASTYDLASAWAHPIPNRKGKPAGALLLYFRSPGAPTATDLVIVEAMVATASLAIDHDRRRAALNSADQRFVALAESIPGVVYQRAVRPNGDIRYTYISEGARELFGVAPDEILSDPNALFDCHGSGYRENFRERLLQASRDLVMWDVEATIVARDGKRKFTHAIARPHRERDGTVVWNGIILDATRIKEAEMRSAEAEASTRRLIVDSLSAGFLMFDAQDRLIISNSAYVELFPDSRPLLVPGVSYETVLRSEAAALVHGLALDGALPPDIAERLDPAQRFARVREAQLPNGRWVMISEHRTPDGRSVTIHTDISKLRKREAELMRSNRELQDFAAVASHDLQEPLRKIEAFGDRLADRYGHQLDQPARDTLDRMRVAATRMRLLINDLLDYSRVTTKASPFSPCDLGKVAAEVLSDLQIRIDETAARITVGDLPGIDADPTQMRMVLQNLISNALKFRRKDVAPEITITGRLVERPTGPASVTGPELCEIEVRDNGIGFDMKYVERIFQIFQRLHGRTEYEGTGIGLATCRKIVERHGGTVVARSEPGAGSTFVVRLPVKHQNAEGAA